MARPKRRRRIEASADGGSRGTAEPDPEQENGHDRRERVDGGAEQQREMARPEHFGRQRRHARQRGHEVDPARAVAAGHCARRVDRCGRSRRRRVAARERRGNRRAADVQRDRDERCDVRVVHAQQVEPGEEAARDAADGIGRIAPAEPRGAASVAAEAMARRSATLRP